MTCLTCQHFSLQASPPMAKLGFGRCKDDGVGVFKSLVSKCARHAPAEKEVAARREAWAAQFNGRIG